jgi:hypothetical protein
MTLVVINFGPCVEYQVVWNVVEIMLTKVCHVHIRTESDDNFCAPRPSVKMVRQNLGYGIFQA